MSVVPSAPPSSGLVATYTLRLVYDYIFATCTVYMRLNEEVTLVINERLTKMAENQEESVRLTEDMRL